MGPWVPVSEGSQSRKWRVWSIGRLILLQGHETDPVEQNRLRGIQQGRPSAAFAGEEKGPFMDGNGLALKKFRKEVRNRNVLSTWRCFQQKP